MAEMNREGREYKAFISANQNSFSRELHKNLRKLHRHHPKEYWSILKSSDRTSKSEPKVSLSDFENHFKNLNHDNQPESHNFNFSDIDLTFIEEFNLEFTFDEVMKNIKTLQNNKSEGADFIKNEYLKNCPENVVVLRSKCSKKILQYIYILKAFLTTN